MKLWWIWTKTSPARFFLPLTLFIGLYFRLDEPNQDFRFELQWTTAVAGEWIMSCGAIVAGATAWEAWLARRRMRAFRESWKSSDRGVFAVWSGAVGCWFLFHAVIICAHFGLAFASSAIGEIEPFVILVQFVAVGGFCALGAVVGWFGRWPYAAPLLTVVLIYLMRSEVGVNIFWFTGASSLLGWQPIIWSFTLQALVFAGCILLVVSQIVPRVIKVALVVSGLTISLCSAVPASEPGRHFWESPKVEVLCEKQESAVIICGPKGTESLFPRLANDLVPIAERLRTLGVKPPTSYLIISGESAGRLNSGQGAISVNAINGRSQTRVQDLIMAASIQVSCSFADPEFMDRAVTRQAAVYGWILKEFETDDPGRYPGQLVEQIRALDPKQQRAWFTQAYREAWACGTREPSYPDGVKL